MSEKINEREGVCVGVCRGVRVAHMLPPAVNGAIGVGDDLHFYLLGNGDFRMEVVRRVGVIVEGK